MPSQNIFYVNNSVVIQHSSQRFYDDINDCILKILHALVAI
jgi:hypothetical protein